VERLSGHVAQTTVITDQTGGFVRAGQVQYRAINLPAPEIPLTRSRHPYGWGPFARLVMPPLPDEPGAYLWQEDSRIVYVGQTRTPLVKRLGPNGYSTISAYNTLAREAGRRNGGQQTNCRVNALANQALASGHSLTIWYRVANAADAARLEQTWMAKFGMPSWNRKLERVRELTEI
jgi:hypothetical protein